MNPHARIRDKKLLSKYQQNVMERRQFRNQMRNELKALAKQSFVDEFNTWKSVPGRSDTMDSDGMDGQSVQTLEQEIRYLQQVVEDLNQKQSGGGSSTFQWSSQFARDQRPKGLGPRSPASSPQSGGYNDGYDERGPNSPNQQNSFFVLSSAPINGFDTIIHQQITSRSTEPVGSLLEQANRYAEITSLFSPPDHAEEDHWFKRQFEEYDAQTEAERIKHKEQLRAHRKKLEATVEQHKDRLSKARQSPRRFPLEVKPSSTMSPRSRAHGLTSSSTPFAATTAPQPPSPLSQSGFMPSNVYNISAANSVDAMAMDPASPSAPGTANGFSNKNSPNKPATANTSPAKPVNMNVDDFSKQTDNLAETIKKMVKDVVHQEIVNDCKDHHYTQRMQHRVVAKHEDLLIKRIEKSLGSKVKAVHEELEKMKAVKLIKLAGDQEQWVASQDVTSILGPDATTEEVQMLTQEVKSVVNQALKMHFLRMRGESGDPADQSSRTNGSRVHGSINTRSSFNANQGKGMGDFDHDPTPVIANLVEEIIVKPKSKAERMLGISTDAKSGLQVNDAPAASNKAAQGGLFGSIGSLFSTKNQSGAPMDNGRSSKPMASGLYSTRSEMSPSLSFMSKMHLDPIADEDEEKSRSIVKSPREESSSMKSDNGAGESARQQIAAELAAEEIVYRDLMANLVTMADVKNNVKKELKDWENDFQKRTGREATPEDKMVINDRFIAYKMVCNQVQDAKDQAKASEEKMKEIKARM